MLKQGKEALPGDKSGDLNREGQKEGRYKQQELTGLWNWSQYDFTTRFNAELKKR